MTNSFRDVRQ